MEFSRSLKGLAKKIRPLKEELWSTTPLFLEDGTRDEGTEETKRGVVGKY